GALGDFYLNTASNTLFGPKTSGGWGSGVSLVGPAGAQGPQGTIGPQGPAGPVGSANSVIWTETLPTVPDTNQLYYSFQNDGFYVYTKAAVTNSISTNSGQPISGYPNLYANTPIIGSIQVINEHYLREFTVWANVDCYLRIVEDNDNNYSNGFTSVVLANTLGHSPVVSSQRSFVTNSLMKSGKFYHFILTPDSYNGTYQKISTLNGLSSLYYSNIAIDNISSQFFFCTFKISNVMYHWKGL
ncbi:MAG: collagen-like protein, partial [Schleiferiaceae bacterium]|nr:collagen-like protein [Schleiferiaceae bacterium]